MPKVFLMRLSLFATFALGLAGCTMHPTDTPALTGPSSFARALSVTASPDNIVADGSQSTIVATLRDSSGAPVSNVALEVSLDNGSVGSLSSRTIYTDANGRATVFYFAPVTTAFYAGTPAKVVSVSVTLIGTNYDTAIPQHATIKVTPPPVPATELGAPTAAVAYSPSAPKVGQVVLFDASASKASTGYTITKYFWDFGDNQVNDEHGSDASHAYSAAGTYVMVLGVVDELGRIDSEFKSITVTP